jgi:hypothetical protein
VSFYKVSRSMSPVEIGAGASCQFLHRFEKMIQSECHVYLLFVGIIQVKGCSPQS